MSDPKPAQPLPLPPTVVVLPKPIEHMSLELVLRGEHRYAQSIAGQIVHALIPAIEQRQEFLNSRVGMAIVSYPVLWAVCSQSGDKIVPELTRQLDEAKSDARQLGDKLVALEKHAAMLAEANGNLTDSELRAVDRANDLSKQLESEITRLRKLEGDLTEVRADLREKALDEAFTKG